GPGGTENTESALTTTDRDRTSTMADVPLGDWFNLSRAISREKPMAFTIVQGRKGPPPVSSHGTADFWPLVRDQVHPSAVLATDELPANISIGALYGGHNRVNHSAGEFSRDDERTGRRAHRSWSPVCSWLGQRPTLGLVRLLRMRESAKGAV